MRYKDLKLKIIKPAQNGGQCYIDAEAPDNVTRFVPNANFLLNLVDLQRIANLNTQGNELRDFGRAFFDRLFDMQELAPLYNQLLGGLQPGVGLRIQVTPIDPSSIAEPGPSILNLPWEYVYDPANARFLALDSNRISLTRSLRNVEACFETPITPPVRLLTVLANPAIGPRYRIDIEEERRLIEEAVRDSGLHYVIGEPNDPAARGMDVVITHLDRVASARGWGRTASRRTLRRYLEKEQNRPHIIHFGCHGRREDQPPRQGLLLLEQEPQPGKQQGQEDKITASDLGRRLFNLKPNLRLVVFNACSTAATPEVDVFKSIAEAAVQAGIPAAIAMQFDIPLDIAPQFAHCFYARLFESCLKNDEPIDLAMAQAREDLLDLRPIDQPHWGIPVLYRHPLGVEPFTIVRATVEDLEGELAFCLYEMDELQRRTGNAPLPPWAANKLADYQQRITNLRARIAAM